MPFFHLSLPRRSNPSLWENPCRRLNRLLPSRQRTSPRRRTLPRRRRPNHPHEQPRGHLQSPQRPSPRQRRPALLLHHPRRWCTRPSWTRSGSRCIFLSSWWMDVSVCLFVSLFILPIRPQLHPVQAVITRLAMSNPWYTGKCKTKGGETEEYECAVYQHDFYLLI